ncbi:hypothetical protein JCM6882_008856 [Rhodosporidiobolus microsporus]
MKRKRESGAVLPSNSTTHHHHHHPHPSSSSSTPTPAVHPSHWTVWHSSAQRWTRLDPATLPVSSSLTPPHPPSSSSSPTRSLSLLTYNTFSSSPSHTPLHSSALLSLLRSSHAHVLALQEISLAFFRLLVSQPWVRDSWAATTPEGYWGVAGEGGGGPGSKQGAREACVVLVRKELLGRGSGVGFVKLPRARDEQGKALVVASLHSAGREQLRIATSHFTSLPENAPIRASQYALARSVLFAPPPPSPPHTPHPHPHPHPRLVLLADFNASSEPEFAPLLVPLTPPGSPSTALALVDACPPSSPTCSSSSFAPRKRPWPCSASKGKGKGKEEGEEGGGEALFRHRPTFGHLYPLVSLHARKPRKPRRIDRVYVSAPPGLGGRVKTYAEIGGEPLKDERGGEVRDRMGKGGRAYASDHVGVRVEVEWEGGGEGGGGEEEEEEETERMKRRLEEGGSGSSGKRRRRKKRRKKSGAGE